MTDHQNVEIQVTLKLVDEGHYEFSYAYGEPPAVIVVPGKVVETGSSTIAAGLAMPVAYAGRG